MTTLSSSTASVTTPLVDMNHSGSTGTSGVIINYNPAALDSLAGHFTMNCATYPTINMPASSRHDTVWTFGYNSDENGSPINTSEPALALHWENWYNQGGTDPISNMEWFLEFHDTNGAIHRPIAALLPRDGNYGQLSWQFGSASMYDWAGNQRIKWDFTNAGYSIIDFTTPMVMQFAVNNSAVITQLNAAGTAYVSLLHLDSTDKLSLDTNTKVGGTLEATGAITGNILNVTGSAVPANVGIYGPGGNMGFAVGGVLRAPIDPMGLTSTGHVQKASKTVSQLGALSPVAGREYYCSNESGGAVPVFGDGTNWRRVTDRAIIS